VSEEINVHHHYHREPRRNLGCLGVLGILLVLGAIAQAPWLLIPTAVIAALVVVKLAKDRQSPQPTQPAQQQRYLRKCHNCGAPRRDIDRFCRHCGTSLAA
jgi:hypothetical protein